MAMVHVMEYGHGARDLNVPMVHKTEMWPWCT